MNEENKKLKENVLTDDQTNQVTGGRRRPRSPEAAPLDGKKKNSDDSDPAASTGYLYPIIRR